MIHLEKQLTVAGTSYGGTGAAIVADEVALELNAVGRAVFRVEGTAGDVLQSALRLASGYRGGGAVYPLFAGMVTEALPAGENETRIVAREPAMLLELPAGFALRHVTPAQVLAKIEELTGLRFLLPDSGAYLAERAPYFSAEGSCRQALDAMGAAWEVPRAVWASLPDGAIYWGDWEASPFNQDVVVMDPHLVVELDPEARALVLPWMPRLRPGVVIEADHTFMVQRAVFSGSTVRVEWGDV